ncbi:hypothetical protein AALO_G00265720 [Alosa alosa]|uniref:Selenoprotein H n=1 Tax=Alosa alosa TaxID=278164 RepID=A0AAV6FLE0_9TELE|nr:hypothetical protein AALO_G00265720 [Alosa alosa]
MAARPNSKTGRGSKRKAEDHDLKEDAPSLDNKKEKPEDVEKPRHHSFEVTLVDAGKETCLWTGIKKGPPAKLRFPDPEEVVSVLKEARHSK